MMYDDIDTNQREVCFCNSKNMFITGTNIYRNIKKKIHLLVLTVNTKTHTVEFAEASKPVHIPKVSLQIHK